MLNLNNRLMRWPRLALGLNMMIPMLVLGLLLRLLLVIAFRETPISVANACTIFFVGWAFDIPALFLALIPVWWAMILMPVKCFIQPWLKGIFLTICFAIALFNAAAEYFFFEEFTARYNRIAVDYLIYPTEVFTNLWQSYNLPLFASLAILMGALLAFPVIKRTSASPFQRMSWVVRIKNLLLILLLAVLAFGCLYTLPVEVNPNRVTNEFSRNGLVELIRAYWNSDLNYTVYYRTLPTAEARARAARVLGFPAPAPAGLAAPEGMFEMQKNPSLSSTSVHAKRDVLVVLEESFGSEFVGVLGHPQPGLTPRFDQWSGKGLLLTHLIANGNRTVRGLEGVLCSFPPLPGDSVVKRLTTGGFATLAAVYKSQGYKTEFFYGGYGIFDHMKPFMIANGWDHFIEQSDYPSDSFKTAWGVADEHIFDKLLEHQMQAAQSGERLFTTLMSVSNHKPYNVPDDRTGRPKGEKSRQGAVAYSDWALGHYLDMAKKSGILDHTIVLIVGDHGARVYGSEEIPVSSYRIPALFLTPDPQWTGKKIERLCSQMDLGPTLLALSDTHVSAPFFGCDLTSMPDGPGRAFVHHNRDIGILTDDALVVLGLKKTVAFYRRKDRSSDKFERLAEKDISSELHELLLDTTAVFQTADELYRGSRFRLPQAHSTLPTAMLKVP